MDWKKEQIVVTGASGFVGSHLCERLLALGAPVRAVVHGDPQARAGYLRPYLDGRAPNLEIRGGDLADAGFVRSALDGAATVFHLGAVTSVAYSYAHPAETLAVNGMGTQHVCEACRQTGVRRLVHTSTAGVYGNAVDEAPFTETHRLQACNPYTAGKMAGDHMVETYHLAYGLPAATVRLFNTYGPRMGRFLILPTIVEQLLEGPTLRLGDLRPTRPFVYVDDIVDAYVRMAEADGVVGEVVHFGGSGDVSMAELVEETAAIMGVAYELVRDPARMRPGKSEIFRVRVDTSKAQRLLGWQPKTSLRDGLARTVAWIRDGGYRG